MSKTVELSDQGVKVVDTVDGIVGALLIRFSGVSVTVEKRETISILTGVSDQAINFGSIGAGKIFAFIPSGTVTLKVNAQAGMVITTLFIAATTAGGITAATWSNSSGATVTAEILIAGTV